MLSTTLLACFFSFFAGFIDAVAGGGGLILVPALFILLPESTVPATVLGTNKLASFAGTTAATLRYLRAVRLDPRVVGPAAVTAPLASALGSWSVRLANPAVFRPLVAILLVGVAIYTFVRKDFGALQAPRFRPGTRLVLSGVVGATIGFYDGFIGPGTGSFLIFSFIGFFGCDFLLASATAKVINWATNAGSLAVFIPAGNVLYRLALPMAACSVLGGLLGARLAILKGSGFVRALFLAVVTAVIGKFLWDSFLVPVS